MPLRSPAAKSALPEDLRGGVQLAARAGADDQLLRVASWREAAIGFNRSPG